MSRKSRFSDIVEVGQQSDPKDFLPEKVYAQYDRILKAYYRARISVGNQSSSIISDIGIIENFTSFTRMPPWDWTEDNFLDWSYVNGVVKQLQENTQGHYQGTIRRFLAYIIGSQTLNNEVRKEFNKSVKQICHDDICIVHKCNKPKKFRTAITRKDFDLIMATFDEEIRAAARYHNKRLYATMRDKFLFFTMYVCGFRNMEVLALNYDSFYANEDIPELGEAGVVNTVGKFSKARTILISHLQFPEALEWYLDTVRPKFAANGDPNEKAMFLSENGERLKKSALWYALHKILQLSGLKDKGYSPHYFRHTTTTHDASRFSVDTNRRQRGHSFSSTTEGYTHLGSVRAQREVAKVIRQDIVRAKERYRKLQEKTVE